jgi:hypothetical protein
MTALLWRCYVALRWWWYRTTGRDCSGWLRSLIAHTHRHGGGTVIVPRGVYHCGDPKLPTFYEIRGET